MKSKPEEIVSILREEIQGYDARVRRYEAGTVLEVGDGIATVYGLDKAVYGELVELDTGVKGMVMNLARDSVGVVLLGSVLLIPVLEPLFEVAALSAPLVGAIVGLAFGSMLVIQLLKAIRTALQKK